MNARILCCTAAILVSCQTPGPVPNTPVPARAARLSVAKCVEPSAKAESEYSQELKPRGQMQLFAKQELEGALGGIDSDVLYGRKVSEGVWAVLVTDYEKRVCEAYISEESAELVNNDPGPVEESDVGVADDVGAASD